MSKLLGLRYRIVYKRVVDNKAADALSRQLGPAHGELAIITIAMPAWLADVQKGYLDDTHAHRVLTQLSASPNNANKFQLQNGIIKQHGRVWLGDNVDLQKQVLNALHTGAIGGHSGSNATYRRVRRLFTWLRLNTTSSCSWTLARLASKRSRSTFVTLGYLNLCLFLPPLGK